MKINTKNCITTTGLSPSIGASDEIVIRPNQFIQLEAGSRHRPPFFRSSTTMTSFSSACSSAHAPGGQEGRGGEEVATDIEEKTSTDQTCLEGNESKDDRYVYVSGSEDDDTTTAEDTDDEEKDVEHGRVVKCRPLLIMTPVKVSARQQQQQPQNQVGQWKSPGTAPAPAPPACDMDVLATEFNKLVSITSSSSLPSPTKMKDTIDNKKSITVQDVVAVKHVSSSSIEKTPKNKKSNKTKKTNQGSSLIKNEDVDEHQQQDQQDQQQQLLGRVDDNHFSYVTCKTSPVKRSMRIIMQNNGKYFN